MIARMYKFRESITIDHYSCDAQPVLELKLNQFKDILINDDAGL
jgi:hypothetical protein